MFEFRVVDLFSGCGGLSKGFENAGFRIQAAFDSWEKANECYSLNFKHEVQKMDLSDIEKAIEKISQYRPEVIIGGPPCQDFSHAGKRQEGKRADLTVAFSRIVGSLEPPYFVMENVDRAQNSKSYARALQTFREAGYGVTVRILDASKCGVPQKRRRLFCIGKRNAEDEWLGKEIDSGLSSSSMTIREYLGDEIEIEYYYRHPRNYSRRGIFSIDEPSPTIRGVNRPIPKGYEGHPADPVPMNETIRPLTSMERARIQTFTKDFVWPQSITKADLEQLIGNAVPVKLGEYVAKVLKKSIVMEVLKEHANMGKNNL